MTDTELSNLRYPIGKFNPLVEATPELMRERITSIEDLPRKLIQLVTNFSEEQLDTPYRPEGWTVRQTLHHIGDSHANSYIRFKWTLTEDKPIIKAYAEASWAELVDSKEAPIELALDFIQALHAKWVFLLKGLTANQLDLRFVHPDSGKKVSLRKTIGLYAWHSEHHFGHIEHLAKREGWI
ncbi:MAG: putative metal-dependent hydrolase [Cytophagales bacterium]|nr:putative metal-dependent hydrolase [Cytophagales bacterium]